MKVNKDICKFFALIFIIIFMMFMDDGLCVFKRYTGIPCPGCGMTRAYISLLKLDFKNAIAYHPLFIFPAIIFFLFIFKRNLFQSTGKGANYFWIFIASIFLITWIIRMIIFFPHTSPMDYNPDGIIPTIIRLIRYF